MVLAGLDVSPARLATLPSVTTAAVILAAEPSTRLGRTKQLERWGDSTLLGYVVAQAKEFPVDEVWVVLGHDSDAILAGVDLGDLGVLENPEWEEGVASSLRVALDALMRLSRCDQALLLSGNEPDISAEVVGALFASHARAGKPVTIPKYRYSTGYPVLVDKQLWPRLMSMEGDDDSLRLFKAHPEWVNEVLISDNPPKAIETEADIAQLRPRPTV